MPPLMFYLSDHLCANTKYLLTGVLRRACVRTTAITIEVAN